MLYNISKTNKLFKMACFLLKHGEEDLKAVIKKKLKYKFLTNLTKLFGEIEDLDISDLINISADSYTDLNMWDESPTIPSNHMLDKAIYRYARGLDDLKSYEAQVNPNVIGKEAYQVLSSAIFDIGILLSKLDNLDQEVEDYIQNLTQSDWYPENFPEGHYGI